MKKSGVLLLIVLILSVSFALADNSTINFTNDSSTSLVAGASTTFQINQSQLNQAYSCLESRVGDCSSLSSVSDIALTILAVPSSSTINSCKDKLISKKSTDNCWPSGDCNIKDTALAVLALNSIGQDTKDSQNWLLSQNKTPQDLDWYIEQDSNSASSCKVSYSGSDYDLSVASNKKITGEPVPCLSPAQSNFWLLVSPSCYSNEFAISCDQNFISTLLYRHSGSPTIYVSSDTKSAPLGNRITLKINSQCFGSPDCDYEGSLWATLALYVTKHDVSNFLPYILAVSDTNKQYLPDSFIYLTTQYQDYGNNLIKEQKQPGNYWEADSSAHGRFYDTALALMALKQSSADQIKNARGWLMFSQDSSGCWNSDSNSVTDTAIILWSLTNRVFSGSVSPTTYCTQAGFFCTLKADCSSGDQLDNYFCTGLSSVCCKSENLKSCSSQGKVCVAGQTCTGNEVKALDTDKCCLADCQTAPVVNECESQGYICKDSCSSTQEKLTYPCSASQVCCRTKTTSTSSGSSFLLWFFIIFIILALAVIAYIMRNKIKLWWFSRNIKSGSNPQTTTRPGFPPRPGSMPPIAGRRPMPMPVRGPPVNQMRPIPPKQLPPKTDNTFNKLRSMSR